MALNLSRWVGKTVDGGLSRDEALAELRGRAMPRTGVTEPHRSLLLLSFAHMQKARKFGQSRRSAVPVAVGYEGTHNRGCANLTFSLTTYALASSPLANFLPASRLALPAQWLQPIR